MKKNILMISGFGIAAISASAQGIRYPVSEMTAYERGFYASAYSYCNPGTNPPHVQVYKIHGANFYTIHMQMDWNKDQFMPWHRAASKYIEEQVQQCGISAIPYWDETNPAYQTTTSPLWGDDFMKSDFLKQWLLNKNRGLNGTLAVTDGDVATALADANYVNFSMNRLEMNGIHANAHNFVAGDMAGQESPRDPVFWMHHIFIDKLFDDWMKKYGVPPASTYVTALTGFTPMATVQRGNVTIPPNSILNSEKDLGIFYARGGVAKLGGGYVVGTGRKFTYASFSDCFAYKGKIEVNNIIVPAGQTVKFLSSQEISFGTGFVNNGQMIVNNKMGVTNCSETGFAKQAAGDDEPAKEPSFYTNESDSPIGRIVSGANSPTIEIEYLLRDAIHGAECHITDAQGRLIKPTNGSSSRKVGTNRFIFDRRDLRPGIHYFILTVGGKRQTGKVVTL
jgi:tyrosinase